MNTEAQQGNVDVVVVSGVDDLLELRATTLAEVEWFAKNSGGLVSVIDI